jgi:pimeloyl-ACP methyl ester carboxylesterase
MQSLDIKNIGSFSVNLWQEGSGTPVLFLHGYERHPGGAPFLQKLAETHTVYAPEQPGYGSSTGFEYIQDMFDVVLFYRELIRSWGHESIDVIGHSSGGMIAGEIAALNPGLIRKLVLVDSFGLWLDDQPSQDPFGAAEQVLAAKWHDPAAVPKPEPTSPIRPIRRAGSFSRPATLLPRPSSCGRSRIGACAGGCRTCRQRRWSSTAPRTGWCR